MENASKALLIAATVLVTIILVTVGIKVYTSTSSTQKVAENTGKTISDKTGEATDLAIGEIVEKTLESVTKDNYGDYIDLGKSVEEVGTNTSADDWRILYNNKQTVFAILADFLPNNNPAVIASGLNIVNGTKYNVNSTINRRDLVSKLQNTTAWKSLVPESLIKNGVTVEGAPLKASLILSYNDKYEKNKWFESGRGYFYIDDDRSKGIDTLYVPHLGDYYKDCLGYWTNTPYDSYYNCLWYVINSRKFILSRAI